MFDSGQIVGSDIVVQPSRYGEGADHSLHKIFSLLARGWTSKHIRKDYPDILPESIAMVRGVLVGRSGDHFPETQNEKMFQDFRVLLDENMSPSNSGYLRQHFRKVSHVHDAGLTGKSDEQVWEWCINNNVDVIFTKDRAHGSADDLTQVAIDDARRIIRAIDEQKRPNITLAALPLLVHLPGKQDEMAELKRLLRRGKDEFFGYLDNRSTPFIDTRSGKVDCGPTYFELRGENHIEDQGVSKEQVQFEKWSQRDRVRRAIYSHLTVEEIRRMSPDRERQIDNLVNAAVGMQGSPNQSSYKDSGIGRETPALCLAA